MTQIQDIAIVGGGPAGAYCAFELAKKGITATVFDHSHPREKPCGGGITATAIKNFPFLEQFRKEGKTVDSLKIISCLNREITLQGQQKGYNISRRILDQQILDMAKESGAMIFKEKILELAKKNNGWQVRTNKCVFNARILVGADGINSLVRKKTTEPIAPANLGLAFGYYISGVENEATTMKFVADVPGYIWIFPRGNHSSVGIGSQCKYGSKLKKILDSFLRQHTPQAKYLSEYAALLPWVTNPLFFKKSCAGDNWVLIGDAAGHADPITGEGIQYALWSGKLAAEAIAKNDLSLYDKLWQEQYGSYLEERCKHKSSFYEPFTVDFLITKQTFQKALNYLA